MVLDLQKRSALGFRQSEVQDYASDNIDRRVKKQRPWERYALDHVQKYLVGDRRENVTYRTGNSGCNAPNLHRKKKYLFKTLKNMW